MKAFLLLIVAVAFISGCSRADVGTRQIVTNSTGISAIYKPEDGYFSCTNPAQTEYEYDAKTFTLSEDVQGSTKNNVQVTMKIQFTADPPIEDADIRNFVTKFGLKAEDRKARLEPLLHARVNTEAKNAIAEFDAYDILANQESIQKKITDSLRPVLKSQMWISLESIQIVGRPDLPDNIEQAAAVVVANQKAKEGAEAALAAAEVDAKRKQIEAQSFANPALLQIKLLELRLQIEQAKANGVANFKGQTLTMIEGNPATQLQLKQ